MYQKITVAGNLGRDPEMRYMPDGTAVTSFSVATGRRYKDPRTNEQVSETTWFRVSVFGRRAEVANQYLNKGSKVLVEGRLTVDRETGGPRLWTRNDGTVAASFEIRATDFAFLSSRADSESADMGGLPPQQSNTGGGGGGGNRAQAIEEDDIPF